MRRRSQLAGNSDNSNLAVLLLLVGISVMTFGGYLIHANPPHANHRADWYDGANVETQVDWRPKSTGLLLLIVGAGLAVFGPFTSFWARKKRSPSSLHRRTSFCLRNGRSWFVSGFTRNTIIVMTIFTVLFIAKNVIPYPPNEPGVGETIYYDIPVRRFGMPFVWFEVPDHDHAFYLRAGFPNDRWETSYFSRGFVARGLLLNLLFFIFMNGVIYWLFRRQAVTFIDDSDDVTNPDERNGIRYL